MRAIIILLLAAMTGCASTGQSDYQSYLATQNAIAAAQANAQATIVANCAGDENCVAVAFLGLAANNNNQGLVRAPAPRKSGWEIGADIALRALGIALPSYVALEQSDNARDIAINRDNTFSSIVGDVANIATTAAASPSTYIGGNQGGDYSSGDRAGGNIGGDYSDNSTSTSIGGDYIGRDQDASRTEIGNLIDGNGNRIDSPGPFDNDEIDRDNSPGPIDNSGGDNDDPTQCDGFGPLAPGCGG